MSQGFVSADTERDAESAEFRVHAELVPTERRSRLQVAQIFPLKIRDKKSVFFFGVIFTVELYIRAHWA